MFVIIMLTAPRPALTKASLSLFIWEFAQPFIKKHKQRGTDKFNISSVY